MKIFIAFDKFKYSLGTLEAGRIAADVLSNRKEYKVTVMPYADGGEGFSEALIHVATGAIRHQVEVHNAVMNKVRTEFFTVQAAGLNTTTRQLLGLQQGERLAVIEMACAAGLAQLQSHQRNPWHTTSYGVGELLRAAAQAEASCILVGLGGSATNDAGAGALAALGVRFEQAVGEVMLPYVPAAWKQTPLVSLDGIVRLPRVLVATDVMNPLLGPSGATQTYGEQKGLAKDDQQRMEQHLARFAHVLLRACDKDTALLAEAGSGAAGGVGFGLRAAFDAEYIGGGQLVESWLDLERQLEQCEVFITGEGRLDRTSLQGKGAAGLMIKALQLGKTVYAFCGSIEEGLRHSLQSQYPNLSLQAITPPEMQLEEAYAKAPLLLAKAVRSALLP